MKIITLTFLLISLISCDTRSCNGHVYIRKPSQWEHDENCGKCKEYQTKNEI